MSWRTGTPVRSAGEAAAAALPASAPAPRTAFAAAPSSPRAVPPPPPFAPSPSTAAVCDTKPAFQARRFKLDIDKPEGGKPMIDLFLSEEGRKETDLIDEFFFEYQGSLTGGDPYDLDREGARVTEGILMMQRLRKMGIRAHFWV